MSQVQYRVPPFYKCCLCFYGFTDEEKKHMEELTVENGLENDSWQWNDFKMS